jgi:hypothetical protein
MIPLIPGIIPTSFQTLPLPGIETSADQWTLSYGRRIDRPNYAELNPFEFKLDDYTFSKGNTRLRPQYANNLQLSYSHKNRPDCSVELQPYQQSVYVDPGYD